MTALVVEHAAQRIPLSDLVAQYRSLQPEIDAAISAVLAARRAHARLYDELLAGSPAVTPFVPAGAGPVYRTYVVRVPRRDDVRSYLAARGITTGLHYVPPLHLQPVYHDRGLGPGAFPVAEQLADELLCLPLYPELSEEAVRQVAAELIHAVTEL